MEAKPNHKISILWVDKDIDNEENQEYKKYF